MKAIVCIDDNKGMIFNNRRQSKDSVVRAKILSLVGDSKLWMNNYSYKQFMDSEISYHNIYVNEDFLQHATDEDFVFIENCSVSSALSKIEEIIVFCWNRKYPADFYFDIDLTDGLWILVTSEDFPGSSHEKITMTIYKQKGSQRRLL